MVDPSASRHHVDIDDFDVPVSVRSVGADGALGPYEAFNQAFYAQYDLDVRPDSAEEIVSGGGYRIEEVDRRAVRTRTTQSMNVRRGDKMLSLRKRPIIRDDRVVGILTLSTDITSVANSSSDREMLTLAADVMEAPLAVFVMHDGEAQPVFSNRASDDLTIRLREEVGPNGEQANLRLKSQLVEAVETGQVKECHIEISGETHLIRDQPLVADDGSIRAVVRTGSDISAVIRANWTEHLLEIASLESTEVAIERIFAVGCDLLDLPLAVIAEVRGDRLVVTANSEATDAGSKEFPITQTFLEAVNAQRVILLRDLAAVRSTGPIIDLLEAQAMASIPITADGDLWGLLAFADTRARSERFPENTAPLLEALGGTLALMVERDRARAKLVPVELLQRSNRELGEFAYAAAHDLRSPLRAMRSFSQLLAREAQEDEPDVERLTGFAQRVMDGADRMDRLLSSMLEHATAIDSDDSRRSVVELDGVVSAAVQAGEDAIADVAGTVTVRPLPVVVGNFDQLQRVFANLIENALKYRHPSRAPRIEIFATAAQQESVDIHVRDNGLGVPDEHRDQIFGLFKRLSVDDKGTGVGLSVVRRIIEDHGGTVSVSSYSDPGSDFVVRLPRQAGRDRS